MSDREFMKLFAGLVGSLAALTIVLIILANAVAGKNVVDAPDTKAIAERIQPVGAVAIGQAPGMNIIATANAAPADKAKTVYDSSCAACHGSGVAGAPKVGDKAAWKPRLAQGNATLYTHAIKGFQGKTGFMPAKGGNASLSDADVKAAVDYMIAQSK